MTSPPTLPPEAATTDVFVRDDVAVTRRIAGETVIVPVRDDVADLDSIYTLNETGSFIWDRLDGRHTVAQLVAEVVAEFEVSPEAASTDVVRLIAGLRAEGLLRAHG